MLSAYTNRTPTITMAFADYDRLHPDDLSAIIDAAHGQRSYWMNAASAAAYLDCPVSRVRKLCMTGAIPHHKDGSRLLFRREELDQFVLDGGAVSP